MTYTTALCGHQVFAWGAPGSKARQEIESTKCGPCRDKEKHVKSQHQQRVERFMTLGGQHVPETPTMPDAATRLLRARLTFEEACEKIEALGCRLDIGQRVVMDEHCKPPDMVKIIDGCCDLSVVTTGTLSACGVPDLPVIREVDRNNLSKVENGVVRDENGKIMKPEGYQPPDIEGVLRRCGWEGTL